MIPMWKRTRGSGSVGDRFHAHYIPEPNTGCWLWDGKLSSKGYGKLHDGNPGNRLLNAHRLAYELLRGPIPDGLQLDHLCRVRSCVNPRHLEPVTNQDNVLRSPISLATANAKKTHCPKGHAYVPENTIMERGKRRCRACRDERNRATWLIRKVSPAYRRD